MLHFEDHQGGALPREDYNDKINAYINALGAVYDGEGSKIITPEFFELLEGVVPGTNTIRRETAMIRARRNYGLFNHTSPATEESSTKVFLLVEEILKYL